LVSKIEWFKKTGGLNEIYQKTGMQFAFVSAPSKEGVQKVCHPWVLCRDFLPDAVRTQLTGKKTAIYGFNFDKGVNPDIDLKKMRMLVSVSGKKVNKKDFQKKMVSAEKLLHHFEAHANIPLTKAKKIKQHGSGKTCVYSFVGSVEWMKSPFMVSIYTFLIRLGDKELEFNSKESLLGALKALKDKEVGGDNDIHYLRQAWDKMHPVLKHRDKLFKMKDGFHDIFFKDLSIGSFHNHTGLQGLVRGSAPDKELVGAVKKLLKSEASKNAEKVD
jgi:hypothetical protein